jgi:hypothetical protein
MSNRLQFFSFPPILEDDIIKSLTTKIELKRRVEDADHRQAFENFTQRPVTTPEVATPIVERLGNNLRQIDQVLAQTLTSCAASGQILFLPC